MEQGTLGPRFGEALVLAARLHANQRKMGTSIPYVAHSLSVAALVLEHGGDEDQVIAAQSLSEPCTALARGT